MARHYSDIIENKKPSTISKCIQGGFLYMLTFTLPLALLLNIVAGFLSDELMKVNWLDAVVELL